MTPGAVSVHLSCSDAPVLVSHGHQLVHVVRCVHHVDRQIFYVDTNI